jgi:hypothetical protein
VVGGDAAAGHEESLDAERQEAAVGDLVRLATLEVHVGPLGLVDVERRAMLSSKRRPFSTSSPVSMYSPFTCRVSRTPRTGAICAMRACPKPGIRSRRNLA